jgi:hypothetical protein
MHQPDELSGRNFAPLNCPIASAAGSAFFVHMELSFLLVTGFTGILGYLGEFVSAEWPAVQNY